MKRVHLFACNRFLAGVAVFAATCMAMDAGVDSAVDTAKRSASQKTAEPFSMDPKTFLDRVQKEPADIAMLLFNPTCPDCEWFMERWQNVAAALQQVQSMVVWTVADPQYQAPGVFDHTHNPDIFFVSRRNKSHPVLLSGGHYKGPDHKGSFFGMYLVGDKRPQAEQDLEFENRLISWFGQQSGHALHSWPGKPDQSSVKAQTDLVALTKKEWTMLMKRWEVGSQQVAMPPTPNPGPIDPVVGHPTPIFNQEADQYADKYVADYLKIDHSGKYTKDYLHKYADAYFKREVYAMVKKHKGFHPVKSLLSLGKPGTVISQALVDELE